MANNANLTASISLNSAPCMTKPTIINLNSDKYNEGVHYYSFIFDLERYNGSSNTLDDPSDKQKM